MPDSRESSKQPENNGVLKYEAVFPLLGQPVKFRSNHKLVIEHTSSVMRHWYTLPEFLHEKSRGLIVDIIIQGLDRDIPVPDIYDFHCRIRGDLRLAGCGKNLLYSDRKTGRALAFVTSDLLQNKSAFSWFVIEPLALFLVNTSRWVTFHSSAVTKNGKALAFMGNSGAGKSTLAYACLRRGFNLLSEDVIYVDLESDSRIWGNATTVNLMPDTIKLFPELENRKPQVRPNGKLKITIPVSEIKNCSPALQTQSIIVCLIEPNHNNSDSMLEPISPELIRKTIISNLEPGFDLYAEYIPAALQRLLKNTAYRLRVGHDLAAATDILMKLI